MSMFMVIAGLIQLTFAKSNLKTEQFHLKWSIASKNVKYKQTKIRIPRTIQHFKYLLDFLNKNYA